MFEQYGMGCPMAFILWDIPPAAGGAEIFFGVSHWPILVEGPLAPGQLENGIFGPISWPFYMFLGDSESPETGCFS